MPKAEHRDDPAGWCNVSTLRGRLARLERDHTPPVRGTIELWFVNDDGTYTRAGTDETLTPDELDTRGGYVIDLTAPDGAGR